MLHGRLEPALGCSERVQRWSSYRVFISVYVYLSCIGSIWLKGSCKGRRQTQKHVEYVCFFIITAANESTTQKEKYFIGAYCPM